jgi:D-beta-D-heptose 7-phosphate kinase/D-beta-D-heptose 1-phosphate adenosyltransferase
MTTVFVNGTFDILHPGHVLLLNTARSLGDYLIVAIDSDSRVSKLKGSNRPINNAGDRRAMLSNLKAVDEVQIFDSDEELTMLVKQFRPDVMMVGSDWRGKPVIGSEYAKRIEYFERIYGYSTTNTIQDIITRG